MNARGRQGTRSLLALVLVAALGGCLGDLQGTHELNAGTGPAGHVVARRLNNDEYANTVRALLYLPDSVQPSEKFPADASSSVNFDNEADILDQSPERAQSYLDAALAMAQAAQQTQAQWVPCDLSQGRSCVQTTLQALANRAYRRPASADEVSALMGVYDANAPAGQAIALLRAVQAVLVSPEFLFITVGVMDGQTDGIHVLNSDELATRLSYFLWRSMPDDELFAAAAASDELRQPDKLKAQVTRMLGDPRSVISTNFTTQWLALNQLPGKALDPTLFPTLTPQLKADFAGETKAFFDYLIAQRRPTSEIYTADYAFMNQRLAAHYGAPVVAGDAMQKVLAPTGRRGILGQASVLTVSSGSNLRTSPTGRGKFVLDKLLCTPPGQPPPNVPSLPATDDTSNLTIRQQMEAHRANPVCASCHAVIDPIGFGLETFDSIGRWRTQYPNGLAVDASGTFPDGKSFAGPAEMTSELTANPNLSICLTKQVLAYAIDRAVTTDDEATAEQIAQAAFQQGGTLEDLIVAIVMTPQFQSNNLEVTP